MNRFLILTALLVEVAFCEARTAPAPAQQSATPRCTSTPCGNTAAGEDPQDVRLREGMLQEHNGNLKIRDRFLIQSCLKSLVLEPEQEDDPRNSFVLSVDPPGISFRWAGDDALTTRIIAVENSSLKMIVDRRNSTQQPTRTRIK